MYKVNVVTEQQINKVIEQGRPGLFWTVESKTGKFIAVYNLEGKPCVGKFENLSNCVDWLKGEVS